MDSPHTWLCRIPADSPLFPREYFRDRDFNTLHRSIMSLFPDVSNNSARAAMRVLFRAETPSAGIPYLVIQSGAVPAVSNADISVRNITALVDRIAAADRARVQVDVQAIRRNNGKDVPVREEDFAPWFAARFGSAIDECNVIERRQVRRHAINANNGKRHGLAVSSVTADVRIADRDAWRHVLENGIGRGKSYGCGLVLAVPV